MWYNNIMELLWSIVATWQGGELVDEKSMHSAEQEIMPEKKNLAMGTKIIFFFAIPLLTLIYSLGVLGALSFPVMLVAVAMNVLLAFELDKSALKLVLLLLVNLTPFAAIYLFSMSFAVAVNSLFVLAFSLPIWLTVRMGCTRSVSIAICGTIAALLWFFSFALSVISEKGALNINTLTEVLDTVIAPIKDALSQITYEENGAEKSFFTSSDISMMLYYIKATLIGSVLAAMIIWAYFSTLAVRILASLFGVAWHLPRGIRVIVRGTMTKDGPKVDISHEPVLWRIDIDAVSVWVYIVAYLGVLFGTFAGGMFYTVVMNVFIMLSPGFIYLALRDMALGFRGKGSSKGRFFPIVIGLMLLFINPSLIVFVLCALGIFAALRDNRARREGMRKRKE